MTPKHQPKTEKNKLELAKVANESNTTYQIINNK